jgi:hypothetical protein
VIPVDFAEANRTFTKPAGATDEQCGSLRVYDNGEQLLSMWQPDEKERRDLTEGGSVLLWVTGAGHPPVALSVAPAARPAVDLRLAQLQADLERARATNTGLNRRAQQAESDAIAAGKDVERLAADVEELGKGLAAAQERIRMLECALAWTTPSAAAVPPAVPDADEGDAPAEEVRHG